MKNLATLIAAVVAGLVLAPQAVSAGPHPAFMTETGPTSPPIGHYEFCEREPASCAAHTANAASLTLTRERWHMLLKVNHAVNTEIMPETDEAAYGMEEYWTYPDHGVGDCEDYALLKRKRLKAEGFPASVLLLTVVRRPNGEGHAVLTVHTDRGDFVLDNMHDRVLLWSETDYTYLKRQSSLDAKRWEKISNGRPALVGSVR
ncbi:transglutaminase-like cysteine peptidase [Pararhizobium mangrovi]|uniref:Transglutaminase n=1 Tax=Pararhizobium mangrovi TaxID=2590452 RepID=A0A506UGM2_9HYPH|nr:transglutaminase-like cysteine peptidase [Pararhizobium mangrovi]TPW31237.1 transglutaminase [Pararhizobium mangrovi]